MYIMPISLDKEMVILEVLIDNLPTSDTIGNSVTEDWKITDKVGWIHGTKVRQVDLKQTIAS